MPKNIIFCADGTWSGDTQDSAKSPHFTNVYKLFCNLGSDSVDKTPYESENGATDTDDTHELERQVTNEGTTLQIAKYLHGVGDSDNALVKMLGGTIGAGLVGRVIRGYTFISRHYEPGDRIHLIGFSRGAYTARALAGLISAKGLLSATTNHLNDREAAYKLGLAVWGAYRNEPAQSAMPGFGKFQAFLLNLPHLFDQKVEDRQLVPQIKIQTVAVWDTVGSVGIPGLDSKGHTVEALQFVDNKLSPAVAKGFHAIALDECRESFPSCGWAADERIAQVLFPGAHNDVGGGNPAEKSRLSDGALKWMIQQLATQDVLFSDTPKFAPSPDAMAAAQQPWTESPWNLTPPAVRSGVKNQMDLGFLVHASVDERMKASPLPDAKVPGAELPGADEQMSALYRPKNLENYLAADGISIRAEAIVS